MPLAALLGMGTVQTLPALPGPAAWWAWLAGVAGVLVVLVAAAVRRSRPVRGTSPADPVNPTCAASASRTATTATTGTAARGAWILWAAWVLLAALAGFGLTAARATARMGELLPARLEGQVMPLTGHVDSLPQRATGAGGVDGWRFVFAVDSDSPSTPRARVPGRLLLSCYQMPSPPRAGERWRFEVKLRRPHGLMNPRGFDQALWMLEQDLPAAGSCRAAGQSRLGEGAWRVDALRQSLRDAIDHRLAAAGERRGAGVLAALSLGDQGAVGPMDWALYRDTGVSHLLSVSGLHVTMFAWLAGAVAGWAWRRSPRLCLRWPAPRAAMWTGVLAAVLYAVFSGWGVPAQRTVGLLAILALLRQAGLRWPWPMSLCAAAAVVCAADPWALTQPGFWLSFCAVALLMAADPQPAPGWRAALRGACRAQGVVTLGLAPLTLLLFQQLSVVGLLANAVAIPLVSYVITPLAMLGALLPPAWTLGAWLVALLNWLLEALRDLPLAVWHLPWAPGWAQVLGLAGGVALAMPWPWRMRLGGLALCVPMLWPVTGRPASGHVELWLPDIGQGGAAILRTHRHTMLFDTGPRWGPGSDAARRVLLPMLRGLGERRLDLLMVSHADQDHAGGTASLLQAMPVARRLGAVPDGEACRRGQRWTWDGVRFEVLSPIGDEPRDAMGDARAMKRNARSCVLRVEAAGRRLLLTGDIESPQEAWLVREEGVDGLRAEVLVVPHHGSRTSSSPAFVRAVSPRVAAVQSGYLNRFGHPRPEVVARYAEAGALVLNSVDCGAWRWRSDRATPPSAACERAIRRRYWLPDRVPAVEDAAAVEAERVDAPPP
ncbi:DNA internalization-related competence protein ComEC/Rec2 [Mitsuaria sp. GD03876]|uniref:DNA internalization-related competence protein ComEC/Rec2 n=1 Tax=Mitsuaria sp. GD03876 TaxID=2975399 RepID=UPI0024496818|nr:DNA internalization-related competence protein ComEC/Rec2 [Mitsuaria sp. GD03876]MDH0867964.1 DNA internalization-related competence protein ComEC/Rec2 [Mitsuaria sp. GD03876]